MEDSGRIAVQGKGAIHVVPDVTRLEISIERVFDNYAKAYNQAKDNSSWMVKILEYNKKAGKLAKTVKFDISDHKVSDYDSLGHYTGSHLDGYELEQVIKVDLPIDNVLVNNIVRGVGKFIPGAQINIGYTVQDSRPCQLKMLERAVHDAKEKAGIMAEAAGCKLGRVVEINYSNQDVHAYSQARNIHSNSEASASTAGSLDITPDDLVVSDTVDVTWELEAK
jgi:uncharacterized protein YggE